MRADFYLAQAARSGPKPIDEEASGKLRPAARWVLGKAGSRSSSSNYPVRLAEVPAIWKMILTIAQLIASAQAIRGSSESPDLASNGSTSTTVNAASTTIENLKPPSEDSMKFPLYMRIMATMACLLIFTVGVCGNLLVPLVVIKTKYLRNSTNLFLINLSIADLLVLIVCMPTVLIELHSRPETWLLGESMCKYSSFDLLRLILARFSGVHSASSRCMQRNGDYSRGALNPARI